MKALVTSLSAIALLAGCDGNADKSGDGNKPIDTGKPTVPSVFVNEVMASNATILQDEVGQFPDWIELYNPNDTEVDIAGWWLTDDVSTPFKWRFPDGVNIPATGYLVVFADGDTEEGPLHASFKLSATGGEDMALFGPSEIGGPLIDAVEDMDAAVPDVSLARQPDGGPTWEIEGGPTPGESNG